MTRHLEPMQCRDTIKISYDPLSNMLASIRYAVSTYGSLAAAYRGVGYENGMEISNLSDLLPSLPMLDREMV
ncbi:hypothetical protein [Mediterraneibacter gnavus]|uniref:hypothetical protein n=1 Tax=Mediterraneibacter gnavus TaxID=33038 RepID=UPI001A9A2A65|nr:hypothetical protein [Mediterraneibacter gnavus]